MEVVVSEFNYISGEQTAASVLRVVSNIGTLKMESTLLHILEGFKFI